MHQFRRFWNSFKTVAILLSFITNIVSLLVLLILVISIFQIKNGILEPIIDGLHRNFVGLDEAVIERTINVEDEIPVQFDLPLNQQTNVVLLQDVPIAANASFTLPGGGGVINGRVDIVLPQGLVLPVQLDMTVPVDTTIPITLPVDVSIPLKETQLHTPFDNLRNVLEPYVRVLDNLPRKWADVPDFTVDAFQGEAGSMLDPTEDSQNPWPGPGATSSGDESAGEETGVPGETGTAPDAGTAPTSPEATPTPIEDYGIITPVPQQ